MERILSLFEDHIFYIATVDGDQPHVRPFGRLFSYQGDIYLNTGKNKKVYRQMKANPKVELCTFYDGIVVRVMAKVLESDHPDIRRVMLAEDPAVANMYKGRESDLAVFHLTHIEAVVSENGQETDRFALEVGV